MLMLPAAPSPCHPYKVVMKRAMVSSFSGTCRAGRSTLSQLLHCGQHQDQWLSLQTSCSRFMSTRLFVGGLSGQLNESQLKDAFSSFGEVTEAIVITDKETGRSKGFGFVTFALPSHADAAVKTMHGRGLNGKILRVSFAVDRPRGFRGIGGGGGYSGDGGGYSGFSGEGGAGDYDVSSYYDDNVYASRPTGSYGGSTSRN